MTQASYVRDGNTVPSTLQSAVAAGDVRQLPDGRAGVNKSSKAYSTGQQINLVAAGQFVMPKTASIVLLDGGAAYWDRSAGAVHFKPVNDRDFLLGSIVGDAAAADTSCTVNLNVPPVYLADLARDPFYTVTTGTQALGGFLPTQRRGGALKLLLSSTNEAQKTDALAKAGFVVGANAIVEMGIEVVSLGSGSAPDLSVGIASGTHATDADSIAQHLFLHVNGNDANIYFQSKDGTTTVTSTDSTINLTAGTRFEVWFDLRDPSDVQIYVDGVNVLSSTIFDISAAASTLLLLAHLEKTAAADTFEVDVDWLRARIAEQ